MHWRSARHSTSLLTTRFQAFGYWKGKSSKPTMVEQANRAAAKGLHLFRRRCDALGSWQPSGNVERFTKVPFDQYTVLVEGQVGVTN